MKRWMLGCLAAVVVAAIVALSQSNLLAWTREVNSTEPMLAHNVYFTLKDSTPENRQKLVNACHAYLSDHPGTVFYAAGVVSDLDRSVNDRDFDVGLHLVFATRADQDAYQTADKHLRFIEESKDLWKQVRVFDSDVHGPPSTAK